MSTTHKPATPLPWRVAPASEYLNDVSINIDAKANGYVCQMGMRGDEKAEADSEYMVRACNAYPRLVEMVKNLLHGDFAVGAEDVDAHTLLRSLGESA